MQSLQQITGEIKDEIEACHSKGKEKSFATCNTHYNWCKYEHMAVQLLSEDYRKKGYPVDRSVNHGVTDTVIYPKVTITEK